jgi:hypothetical protein
VENCNTFKWVTLGIKVSSLRIRRLNILKKNSSLSIDKLGYIHSYQKICRNVIIEAKRKENYRQILSSHNKTKAVWQIINKETSSLCQDDYLTNLKSGSEEKSNPQKMTDMLNSFFIESVDDLLVDNINYSLTQTSQQSTEYQMNTELEVESKIRGLRRKPSAGFDEIPEYLAKRCSHYIRKPLVHIFNPSLKLGMFFR